MPLVPISRDDEVQGELLVEVMLDEFSAVRGCLCFFYIYNLTGHQGLSLSLSLFSLCMCLYMRCIEVW